MLLTDEYTDKIYGTLTCYDRMIIHGYNIPGRSHAEGMAGYLYANNIRIFDFPSFSQSLTEQVRGNAQKKGKDIRQHLGDIRASAMSRIFKRLRLHGIIERIKGTYKYFPTAYGKEVMAAGLAVRNLVLIPALA